MQQEHFRIGNAFGHVFRGFREKIFHLFLWVGLVNVFFTSTNMLMTRLGFSEAYLNSVFASGDVTGYLLSAVFSFLSLLVFGWFGVYCAALSLSAINGQRLRPVEASVIALQQLLPASALLLALILGFFASIAGPLALLYWGIAGEGALIFIGFMTCVGLFPLVLVFFGHAFAVLAAEQSGFRVFARTFSLVRGSIWRVYGHYWAWIGIVMLVSIALGLFFTAFIFSSVPGFLFVLGVLNWLMNLIFIILSALIGCAVLVELRNAKGESVDELLGVFE